MSGSLIPSGTTQYATFVVGGHYLGTTVLEVQEVLCGQRLTPVPLASPVVEGLINLRGQIVPAVDLRRLLHLTPRKCGEPALSVVVRTAQGPVSLQVDEIGDVIELDSAGLEEPPGNMEPVIRRLLTGVHKLKDRLLLVLDTAAATDLPSSGSMAMKRRTHGEKAN
jgi:purine-binding chemotaxis protein CheW